jgi:chromosome segregation protein
VKFTRLRVLGFKSFVEPTEFVIEPGLTGVVGPNGCGKSNLVEALRWVMGESSYKNMRASGMDDVIFSGSGNRPARNMAEVSLAVDNADRSAPVAFNDAEQLEITRRIEREAGSVYRINGRDVRARDVQLLFADASTGAHSPAIVGQGKIGELIAAKPQDRRTLLEEAAGIAGLHNRRHEAELRLGAAEQNLGRIDDVIAEIDAQLDGLKRQARQAVRYRNLSGEIRKAEATVLHLRWFAATEATRDAEAALEEASRAAENCAMEQARTAREQAVAASGLPDLRDASARAGAALQRIVLAREALDAEEARVKERIADLDRRLNQLGGDILREEQIAEDNRSILARLDEEEAELAAADATMAESEAAAAGRRQACEAALSESEREHSELTAALAEITARRGQLERAVAEAQQRISRHRGEIAKVEREIAEIAVESRGLPTIEENRAALAAAETALAGAEAAATEAERRTIAARETAAAARDPVAESEREAGRIEAEMTTLLGFLADGRTSGMIPLIDAVTVAAGLEAALGAALGDDLDAPAGSDAPAHWRTVEPAADDPSLPDGIASLSEHVQAPALLARRLRQIGVVAREDGPRLQFLLKTGQRLVSREGDLWRWDGYTASADSKRSSAQRLAARNRLVVLEAAAAEAKARLSARRQALEGAVAASRAAEAAERDRRQEWREAQKAVETAHAEMAATERKLGRVTARRSALDEAAARLAAALAEGEVALAETSGSLAATPVAGSLDEAMAAARQRVAGDRAALAEARATVESIALEHKMRRNRIAAIALERKGWHDRITGAERQVTTLRTRRSEAEEERQRLVAEPPRIMAKRAALLTEIAAAEGARSLAADALAEGEALLAAADKAAHAALAALAEARERRGRAEERVVGARDRLGEVVARIADALDCRPEEAAALAELKSGAPLPNVADIEARLERYRQERERLGAVNLRAEAEAHEVGERRNSLVSERDDLVAAIQRLRQGIASLNREGRERLSAAFGTVNAHFKRLFTHLFGGGEAELLLTESEDPLEAGLEIVARPPGKKPQIMTLLSGGEQALTAMSLIFAVFLTNPAPICVLDEVDAPLDDANVERFCNLLDEMARTTDTRFITITHNPITMARMNRLFGVTMAERGVSQLVSVDLQTAERFRDAV